jgi:hypothetical protein
MESSEKEGERPHPYEDSCGDARCVNEYGDKLNASTTKEKYQRSIIFIGGVEIFLPSS